MPPAPSRECSRNSPTVLGSFAVSGSMSAPVTCQQDPAYQRGPAEITWIVSFLQLVQSDVELEDVHPGLAQEPEVPSRGVPAHQAPDHRSGQVPGRGHPVDLNGRVSGGDVRV